MEADISSQAVGLASSTDFSIVTLFLRADVIVKTVILILIASSIYSWAIIIEKLRLFKQINLSTEEFENKFWKSKSAESFYNNLPGDLSDPMANIFRNSMQVLLKSKRSSNLNEKMSRMLEINIEQEIEKGNFIRNLFERLNVINIKVPPISKRREDIIPICNYYLNFFNKNKKFNFIFSKNASIQLEIYNWPGDVRQIINYIEKTIILNQDLNLESDYELDNLQFDMEQNEENNTNVTNFALSLKNARQNFEKEYFLSQIKRFSGNMTKISDFTGMERTALYRKLKSLNISFDNK